MNKAGYIRAATTLAFRRAERDRASEGGKHFYNHEIDRLRAEVARLLGKSLPQGRLPPGPQQQMVAQVPRPQTPVRR